MNRIKKQGDSMNPYSILVFLSVISCVANAMEEVIKDESSIVFLANKMPQTGTDIVINGVPLRSGQTLPFMAETPLEVALINTRQFPSRGKETQETIVTHRVSDVGHWPLNPRRLFEITGIELISKDPWHPPLLKRLNYSPPRPLPMPLKMQRCVNFLRSSNVCYKSVCHSKAVADFLSKECELVINDVPVPHDGQERSVPAFLYEGLQMPDEKTKQGYLILQFKDAHAKVRKTIIALQALNKTFALKSIFVRGDDFSLCDCNTTPVVVRKDDKLVHSCCDDIRIVAESSFVR